MIADLKSLENRIMQIEDRNKKVESDKCWEISYMRKIVADIFLNTANALSLNFLG